MGGRCSVAFQLAWKISSAHIEPLAHLMAREGLHSYSDNSAPNTTNIHEKFWGDEINYGTIDSVIAYELWNAAGGGYGSGLVRFDGERRKYCPSIGEGPAYPLAEIMKIETLATCLADVLALARFMCAPLPPVEIVP